MTSGTTSEARVPANRSRDMWRLARLTVLWTLLTVVATLNYWSHQGDPRFYVFLNSPVGTACARVFGWWKSPLERPIADKGDRQLTRQERAVKDAIQHAVNRRGDAREDGQSTRTYQVTYRDVAFRLEYADAPLYLYPPYAIVSELPAIEMDRAMTAVRDVYAGFRETFGPLLSRAPEGELIHLLYFASEASYLDYQRQHTDALDNTSGFYSPARDRLVLYRDPAIEDSLSLLTVRHEAAHQLFYTYGVHSQHRIENEWLIEGLASYCETPRVGGTDANQVGMLDHARESGDLIPLDGLVNHRNDRGLLAYKPTELAYAQSWGLVHYLMQEPYRERFFDYILYLRSPASFRELRHTPRIDVLCRFLDLTPDALQAEWETHLRDLAAARIPYP